MKSSEFAYAKAEHRGFRYDNLQWRVSPKAHATDEYLSRRRMDSTQPEGYYVPPPLIGMGVGGSEINKI